jgi:hypothetical protein
VEKAQLTIGRHDEQTVRLGDGARHLGEELRPRDTNRDRQTDAVAHLSSQPRGDLGRRARDPLEPANVKERLVDRQPFDERRAVLENAKSRLARLGVGRHSRRDHDRARTQPPGLPATHRGTHSESLGLVARGQHHSRADDDRPAAQAWIISLLDGRVERVEVGVKDRRRAQHEHMFAQRDRIQRP